ncbi:MAG: hypothetical protein ACK5A0_05750 [Polaromonas sp.]|jgi:hypothetical protein
MSPKTSKKAAFHCGEFTTIKSQARRGAIAITPMRSLLADHNIKRLAR